MLMPSILIKDESSIERELRYELLTLDCFFSLERDYLDRLVSSVHKCLAPCHCFCI